MKILAIEQSTLNSSIALLDNNKLIQQASKLRQPREPSTLIQDVAELLHKNSLIPKDIDIFGVGLGPGIYSGLRISLSTLNGFALPEKTKVYGVSSAFAIAYKYGNEYNMQDITVIGDARRNRIWYAKFTLIPSKITQKADYELIKIDDFCTNINKNETIITADWHSLNKQLADITNQYPGFIQKEITPDAATVGEITYLMAKNNIIPDFPLSPIYIHPPVFVKPRFPARTAKSSMKSM